MRLISFKWSCIILLFCSDSGIGKAFSLRLRMKFSLYCSWDTSVLRMSVLYFCIGSIGWITESSVSSATNSALEPLMFVILLSSYGLRSVRTSRACSSTRFDESNLIFASFPSFVALLSAAFKSVAILSSSARMPTRSIYSFDWAVLTRMIVRRSSSIAFLRSLMTSSVACFRLKLWTVFKLLA